MMATTAPSPRGRVLFLVSAVALVAALAIEGYLLLRPKRGTTGPARPRQAVEAIATGPAQVETFGDPAAPIEVKLYAPLALAWHQKTIRLLRDYDKAHPRRLRVTLMPMGNAECDEEMQDQGYFCATILVNGQNSFLLPEGRRVTLTKMPNQRSSYSNSEDVITVIEELLAEAASPAAAGSPASTEARN